GGGGMDAPAPDVACNADGAMQKPAGQPCACASECASNFCVDGVCCQTACAGGCQSCAVAGSVGVCTSLPAGSAPRNAGTCVAGEASDCGQDGKCDGIGGCRKYPAGTVCRAGTCDGDA